jgi:hypothetical protein
MRLPSVLLLAVGLVNLLPGLAGLLPSATGPLYGVTPADPSVELMLRHRAILLALVGAGLLTAVLIRRLRPAAMTAAAISMSSFVVLQLATSDTTPQLARVATVDIFALAALALAARLKSAAPIARETRQGDP